MKATIVVTCYNHEKYIAECLDSILAQKINFDCDILVADDCSTDATVAIIKKYQLHFPNHINLIARDKNLGHARHYIETHKVASGDIIFEFDGDDIMLPDKLQKQYDLFKQNPLINLVFHRAEYFSDDGTYKSITGLPAYLNGETLFFDYKDLALWGTIAAHGSYAYRKSSRKTADPKREFMEWFFAMDSLMPSGHGVYLDEVLMKYRCNPKGKGHGSYLSSKKGRAKAYTIYLQDVVRHFDHFEHLRPELYANCLITSVAMLKAGCGYARGIPQFLLKNVSYFCYAKVMNAVKMRLSVAPGEKVR